MKKLLLFTLSALLTLQGFSQVLYNNSTSGSYFRVSQLPPTNSVFLDDVNIPSTLIGANDSIRFTMLKFGLYRLAGAPATTLEVFYSNYDDTATLVPNLFKIPPTLIGTVALPAQTTSGQYIATLGDSVSRLFAIAADTGNVFMNYQTVFLGIRFADTTLSGWQLATGGANYNYFWHYNPTSNQRSAYRFSAAATPPAAFNIRAYGAPVTATVPVKLASFAGVRKNNNVYLEWQTETEANNNGFSVERSTDGNSFESIGFVATKADGGNSSANIKYNYIDEINFNSALYYRLKQIDKDGKTEYSSIVVIKGNEPIKFQISGVYPNPVVRDLNIKMSILTNEKVQLSVSDINGRLMMQESRQMNSGENLLSINVNALASGTYIIKATTASGEEVTTKFVKN